MSTPRPSAYEPRDLLLLFLMVASFLLGDRIAVLRPGRLRHSRDHKEKLLEAASESKNSCGLARETGSIFCYFSSWLKTLSPLRLRLPIPKRTQRRLHQ